MLRFHQQPYRRRGTLFPGAKLADELLQPLGGGSLRLQHLSRPCNGLGDARFVERLQNVVHGVHIESLHRILVKRRGKHHVRHFHLPLHDLFQHAKPIQPGHLHVQKH